MPPVQKAFQMESTWFRISPLSIAIPLGQARALVDAPTIFRLALQTN